MKFYTLLFGYFLCFSSSLYAQCPANATAGALSGTMTYIQATDSTNIPVFTTQPQGLPNTEFIILQNDSIASDGFGPRILTSSLTGRVAPNQWNLTACNELCVVPFSYNLSQLQTIVDSLFGAMYVPGVTCCAAADQFFSGLCGTLNTAGISSGSDINSLEDVITLVSIFAGTTGGSISLTNFTSSIDQLNASLLLFGSCSGGVSELCYRVSNTTSAMDCYTIVEPGSSTWVSFMQDTVWMAPNDSVFLHGTYLPNSSSDSLTWYLSNPNSNFTIQSNISTGLLFSGNTVDTAWVILQATRGCRKDTLVVIIDPLLDIPVLNNTILPISVHPNPFQQQLHVQFTAASSASYRFRIVDITGRIHLEQTQHFSQGAQTLALPTTQLPQGYYLLEVSNDKTIRTQPIIKQ